MDEDYLSKEEAFRTIHGLLGEQDDSSLDDQDEP